MAKNVYAPPRRRRTTPPLRLGRVISNPASGQTYRLTGRLGEGGFGSVFECERGRKRLAAKFTYNEKAWSREVHFGELLAGIDGAVQMVDSFKLPRPDSSGRTIFAAVTELASGDLGSYLDANGPMDEERIAAGFTDVLRTLSHLHERRAFHCDLTPWNVFLDPGEERLLLGDFGIARYAIAGRGVPADVFNPWYCPPEIDVTTKTWAWAQDVWQVGQLMAVCVSGNPYDVIEGRQVRDLRCSNWLKEVIYRAIGTPASIRYWSAWEMADSLGDRRLALQRIKRARPRSLVDQEIAFTAGIPGLFQHDAKVRAEAAGAIVKGHVTRETDLLVVGGTSPLYAAGSAGSKLIKALAKNDDGASIRWISGSQFEALT